MSGEFELIARYFQQQKIIRNDVLLTLGDDCALLTPPVNMNIAISTDSLVEGTHFLKTADPAWIAHKALVANLSDLAAMGASPAWLSLALTLPKYDELWLEKFSESLFSLADKYQLQLIGGDTTRGPLNIGFTIQGFVPQDKSLPRFGAKTGDLIYVSGDLGQSIAGLDVLLNQTWDKPFAKELAKAHFYREPRIALGQLLLDWANSAIDISDGLISDLAHICQASELHAKIELERLPICSQVHRFYGEEKLAQQKALVSGEEYELCFTIDPEKKIEFERTCQKLGHLVQCIGNMQALEKKQSYVEAYQNKMIYKPQTQGYDHFN